MRSLLNTLMVEKTDNLFIQLFRYFMVSGLSLVVDFATLLFFTEFLGLYYLVSATLSYSLGLVLNYFISVAWVFNTRKISNRSAEFAIFAIIGILGLGINVGILWIWTSLLGLYYLAGRVVSAGIGYVWKYVARRIILFRR